MGVPLLLGLIFLFLIFLSVPIVFFIFKKNGNAKLGILISILILIIGLSFAFMNTIDSILYGKKDLREDLNFVNINLSEPYKIIKNDISGFPEYFQKTEILIGKSDRKKIIESIKMAPDFKVYDDRVLSQSEYQLKKYKNYGNINYKVYNYYNRTYFENKEGYVPIYITISIKENSDTLSLDRTED
ncbi:MAG: hypothetical protein Q4G16_08860 [Cruoricaptor ignavus]|nr:hypothetical protein [Cruoricaptor ignavus]